MVPLAQFFFSDVMCTMEGRGRDVVVLYVREWVDCEQRSLRASHGQVESLWVKLKERTNKGQLVAGIYYRLPDQREAVDEAFLLQL